MATHSSVLAWRIPRTGEPGGLPSMGSQSRTQLKRLSSSSSSMTIPTLQRQRNKHGKLRQFVQGHVAKKLVEVGFKTHSSTWNHNSRDYVL